MPFNITLTLHLPPTTVLSSFETSPSIDYSTHSSQPSGMLPFTNQFPDNVWVVIVQHLQNPYPLPLSKPTGHQVFQQPHLAVIMRTAKFLQSIAERLLYTRIYTDCLAELVRYYHLPVPGKRFALTRNLHLEYLPRNEEPTYLEIYRAGKGSRIWEDFAVMGDWSPAELKLVADDELFATITSLDQLCDMGGIAKAFPKLETISVDATRAIGCHIWRQHELTISRSPEDEHPILECSYVFNTFLASGQLRHVCIRGASGPLALEHISFMSADQERSRMRTFLPTVHFFADTSRMSLPFGCKTRWVSDAPPTSNMADIVASVRSCTNKLITHRRTFVHGQWISQGEAPPPDTADVDICCSTDYYRPTAYATVLSQVGFDRFMSGTNCSEEEIMTMTEKSAMVGRLQDSVQALVRAGSNLQDEFRRHVSEDTPTCLACGTGAPT